MILLTSTTDSLEVVLAGAVTTTQMPVYSSYADLTTTTFTPGTNHGTTNNTTAVTLVSAPAASTQRQIKYLSVYNADTVSGTVTVRYNANGTTRILCTASLVSGYKLEYVDGRGFQVLTSAGAKAVSIGQSSTTINVQLSDGTRTATVRDTGSSDSLNVAIVDGSGNHVTSFGGGTQYTEGDTDATITGTAMLMEGAANALVAAQGTAADGLLVNLGSNNDVTVTGTVTANLAAGTNNIGDVDILSIAAGDNNIGNVDVVTLPSIPAGTNNIGDVDVLTVPAPLNLVGGGVEASALRVTIANDSTGVLSVDDNGSSLTVDGTVAATQSGSWVLSANSGVDVGDVTINNASGAAAVNIQDGGNTITVDGTVTANLAAGTNNIGDVDILSIAAGDNNIGNVDVVTLPSIPAGTNNIGDVDILTIAAGDNNIGNVDIVTVPAPLSTTGGGTEAAALRVTIASDSTGVVSIDDNGSSLTVDGTVSVTGVATETTLASLLTSSELIDDSIVTLGTTTYTETTSKGVTIGAVRRDADTTLVGTTNEFGPLQMDANGRLKVEVFSGETLPVSLDSTVVTGLVAASQSGSWVLAANSGVDIGDVTINNAAGASAVNIQDGGNTITVDGTVTANLAAGTNNIGDVDILSIAAGDNNIGNVDIVTVPAPLSTTGGGTEATALRVTLASDSTGLVSVDDNGTTLSVDHDAPAPTTGTVTASGTYIPNSSGLDVSQYDTVICLFTGTYGSVTINYEGSLDGGTTWTALRAARFNADTQEDNSGNQSNVTRTHVIPLAGHTLFRTRSSTYTSGTMNVTLQPCWLGPLPNLLTTTRVIGDVAHDAADAGAPVKIGGIARSTDQTAVATADRVNATFDLNGKQVVAPYTIPENAVRGASVALTGTGDVQVIAAAGAGLRNYITSIIITNSHATVGTLVVIKDGTTEMFRAYVKARDTPIAIAFPVPLRGTANTALNAANVTTGSNTYVGASGYIGP